MSNGLVELMSNYSVDETLQRLQNILQVKNITIFALIDHSGEAAKAGMTMPPTKVLIFGNPRAGTPLMLASPTVAIDLPLKILIREDEAGRVLVSYNSVPYLQDRHGIPADLLVNIAGVEALAAKAAE
jgi:uncharacterized protein (DUF302 family)